MNNKSRQGRTNVKTRKLDLEEFQYKRIGVKALGLCPGEDDPDPLLKGSTIYKW